MKSIKLPLLFLLICFTVPLPAIVFAKDNQESLNDKNIVVRKGEVINRDFFGAGENITISGTINGDVYVAGGVVFVDGKINGDLLAAAGTITLLGEVSDDVRVGGGNILIQGSVGKNLTVGGGNITITKEAKINGSLSAFGGNMEVTAPIGRDAQVFVSRALFGNQIGGDLKGLIGKLTLTSGAKVLGNLEYESKKQAEILEGAAVSGKILYKPKEEKFMGVEEGIKKFAPFLRRKPKALLGVFRKISLFLKAISFLFTLVLGFVFIRLFPKRAISIVRMLESQPLTSLGVGVLTLILFALAMLLLAATIIGIPLALFLMTLFGFLLYFSKIFASFSLGRKVLLKLNFGERCGWALFTGLLIYYLLRLIPLVSPITALAFTTLGLGALILRLKNAPSGSRRASKSTLSKK